MCKTTSKIIMVTLLAWPIRQYPICKLNYHALIAYTIVESPLSRHKIEGENMKSDLTKISRSSFTHYKL